MKSKNKIKILHLDIETAPAVCYSWSLWPKYIPIDSVAKPGYTLCWSAKWDHSKEIMFASIWEDGFDTMIKRMYDLLDEADAVVHYNGIKFDMPTLNREFVLAGFPPPDSYHQIDLYQTVKRKFRFLSNKLDFVCQKFGLGSKVHHKGMSLWIECMAGNVQSQNIMKKYNKQDVRLLPKLYRKLLPWITNHPNLALWMDNVDKPVCTNCGSTNVVAKGTQYNTKVASYKRYRCNDCGTPLRARLRIKRISENVLRNII